MDGKTQTVLKYSNHRPQNSMKEAGNPSTENITQEYVDPLWDVLASGIFKLQAKIFQTDSLSKHAGQSRKVPLHPK